MGDPVIEVEQLRRRYKARTGSCGAARPGRRGRARHQLRRSSAASCSGCSARTVPARPRRSRCSSPCCCRPAGTARVLGHDVVARRRARCAGGSATSSAATAVSTNGCRRSTTCATSPSCTASRRASRRPRIGELLELVGLDRPRARAGRGLLARHAAAAAHRPRPAAQARGALPRRAEHRHRPGRRARAARRRSPTLVEQRHDGAAHHPLHVRGRRALRPDRRDRRRPRSSPRARPAQLKRGVADGHVVEVEVFGVGRRRARPSAALPGVTLGARSRSAARRSCWSCAPSAGAEVTPARARPAWTASALGRVATREPTLEDAYVELVGTRRPA